MNVGFSRKVGEANFGSRGASVNLEIEVESGVVREPDKLQAKINYLFDLAKASVDAQLNGGSQVQQQSLPVGGNGNNGNNGNNGGNGTYANGNGNGNGNSNGGFSNANQANGGNGYNGHSNGSNGHRASDKQINFASQLAKGIRGLGTRRLESLTGRMFGKPLADLTSLDASSLIDTLKAIKEGRVSLDATLSEGTAA
jgi:hypothetical protein